MDEYLEMLKEIIRGNYYVFGNADVGLNKNAQVILGWREDDEITEDQYKELRAYNRHVYSELPLDM